MSFTINLLGLPPLRTIITSIALWGALGGVPTVLAQAPEQAYAVDDRGYERSVRRVARGHRRIAFEVVEFGNRFAFDDAPLDAAGFPSYGNAFITQGVIYPAGTITRFEDGTTNGVIVETDADGNTISRPEFPEKVLGTWICKGTVFGENGFNIESGPVVDTTQLYDFNKVSGEFGALSIVSEGLELIDVDRIVKRALTGGTGRYKRIRGEVEQALVGFNSSEGFTLSFQLNGI